MLAVDPAELSALRNSLCSMGASHSSEHSTPQDHNESSIHNLKLRLTALTMRKISLKHKLYRQSSCFAHTESLCLK